MDEDVNVIYSVTEGGKSFSATPTLGEYDPGNLVEIDRAIRHMPGVEDYLKKMAEECRHGVEKADDFHLIVSTSGESRARVYVAPANDGGVHLELADSVLLKAALSMEGR